MQIRLKTLEQISLKLASILESGKVEVPVLPETAQKVMVLTQDDDSDAAQLANIIQSDPTMGGHVMRIANSAAYTPNSNLVSIQQAVARLGLVEISNIALSTSINSKMFKAPDYQQYIVEIWQHALATALWSKEIARQMRSNVETAFLCGLLHSIGKPVIIQTIADNPTDDAIILSSDELLEIFTQHEISFSKVVASEWGLPDIVTEAISFYQNFKHAPKEAELSATVAFGSQIANVMLNPEVFEKAALSDSDTLDVINLYPDEVEKILDKEATIKTTMETLSL